MDTSIIKERVKPYPVCAVKGGYMAQKKQFKDLDLSNAFLFASALELIKTLKQSRKLEERYMQFEEMLKKEHDAGYHAGQDDGAWKMWELVSWMIADGKTDMIPRLKAEEDFYNEMLQQYHL